MTNFTERYQRITSVFQQCCTVCFKDLEATEERTLDSTYECDYCKITWTVHQPCDALTVKHFEDYHASKHSELSAEFSNCPECSIRAVTWDCPYCGDHDDID